ncbi:hypothetical protein GCM10027321_33150 [Massilia terrae]|uniref:Uncharacterized protein n=1 Tax=Massilia terrae TaxID=1811224 RepID=A0ABT2CRL3_9BURK|nr:hypothetical protein [Massilia terrae]MCS0656607.1 hypothetical protein [Massilia terrae]
MVRLLFILLLAVTGPARAAWLHLCPDEHGAATMPDGRAARIVVSGQPSMPACVSTQIGVDSARVDTVYPLPAGARPEDTILLLGSVKDGRFDVSEPTLPPAKPLPEPPAPMPFHANLLPQSTLRTFGAEERVQARLNGTALELSCRAGQRPAGVLLSGPWYLPRAPAALRAQANAHGSFELQVADTAHARAESAVPMGTIGATALPLPSGLDGAQWRHFVINCPNADASLTVASLTLEPQARAPGPRATWIWRAAQWQDDGDALLSWAREQGIGLLFITVPTSADGVREPEQLASFVQGAHRQHIAVWSVDGDPHMVLPSEQAAAVRLAQAYASYNSKADAAARLDGIQFDIEPYLLGQYHLAPDAWNQRYLALAQALRAAAGPLHLDFVVPFWWAGRDDLLAGLARAADGLTVMDYRTDPGQVHRFAAPFLDWAQAAGKQVRIALEAGPIEPQTQRRYVRTSGAGDLLVVGLGPQQVLVTLRKPGVGAQPYRLSGSRELDGSATTFSADMPGLREMLPALERDFSAWPSFGGMAVHGLR